MAQEIAQAHPDQGILISEALTYSAWLELELGLDSHAIGLTHAERTKLFTERIAQGLIALERACLGIRQKLESFPGRPFAFTALLTTDEIKAIWYLPELRMLSDRDTDRHADPEPDEFGRRPFIVQIHMHIQAEGNTKVDVDRFTLLIHAVHEVSAKADAVEQCSNTMPEHFMGGDYIICRRWWTAEHAHLNTLNEEERGTFGTATILGSIQRPKEKREAWFTDASIERVAYGSPKQRPVTWEWMIS